MTDRALHTRLAAFFLVAVTAASLAAAVRTARASEQLAAPEALVGTWSRVVTDADRARQGGGGISSGRYRMSIDKSANILIVGPRNLQFGGIVEVHGNRIQFDVGASGVNRYIWTRSGRRLTLRLVSDATGDRRAVMIGVWTRAG